MWWKDKLQQRGEDCKSIKKRRVGSCMISVKKEKRFCSGHLDSSWGPWRIQTALRLAVSLWPCSAVCMSTRVSWLLRSIRMLSEPQHQSLYGHSWQTPTSALLVNILGASVLSSFCLCAPRLRALIRASGNQKTERTVTDRGRKKTKGEERRRRIRCNIRGRKN